MAESPRPGYQRVSQNHSGWAREKVSLGVLKLPGEAIDRDRSKWEVLVFPSSSEPGNSLKQEDLFPLAGQAAFPRGQAPKS